VSPGEWWTLGGVAFLIVLAAFFAAAETAFSRLTRVHAMHLEEQKRLWARFAVSITQDPARYVTPVLLCTLTCHVLGTTLATTIAVRHLGNAGEWVATAILTSVIFVFAESAPKTFAIQHTDRVVLPLGPIIYGIGRALYPLSRLLIGVANLVLPGKGLARGPFMSEQEIRHIVDVAEEEEVIEEGEREMIHSIFELGDTVVREVMVPRPDMIVVEAHEPIRKAMDMAIEHGFSRIPVFDGEPDRIVGVVYAKDLFRALTRAGRQEKVSELMREAHFVPDSKKVGHLLREMQQKKVHMAIVVDEYGDVAGLATLEDLIEEIVGEISDEYDVEEPNFVPLGHNAWRVKARMTIGEVNDLLETQLPDEEWDTVGGLVAGVLGRLPDEGDEAIYDGITFRAEKVTGRRIDTVLITRLQEPGEQQRHPA
jgi:CBS domain containing-hemolysin-like protein